MIRRVLSLASVFVVTLIAGMSAQAAPAVLNLSKTPLFVNVAVDPNLMVTFDDSGSMAYGYVPDTVNDTTCFFRYRSYYSAAWNKIYYDPNITYTPPIDGTGTSLGNQVFTNASTNGFKSGASKVNLSTAYAPTYDISAGTPTITYSSTGTSTTSCSSQNYKFPTGSASAFYCVAVTARPTDATAALAWSKVDSNFTCKAPSAAEQVNFANWYAYYRYRSNALKSALSRAMGIIDDDLRVSYQNMNNNPITATTTIDRFAGTLRTNFFTWLFAAPISGNTPTLTSTIRVGDFFKRATGSATTNPYWDSTLSKELTCRQNYHVLVTDGYWNQTTMPSLPAANYSVTTSKTLPDGRTFSKTGTSEKFVWNEATRGANCSSGTCVPDYSDIAFYYWSTDLRPDLVNNVTPYLPDRSTGVTGGAVDLSAVSNLLDVPEIYWNPANDPATWQHVDQFFIGFGIAGVLPFTDDTYTKLRKGTAQWPGALNNANESVDDSWHATLVSRGKAFGATDPNEIVDALTDVLSAIVARKGSAASVSVATGIVTGATFTYQSIYDSTDASGTVLARRLNADFSFDAKPTWDASCILTGGTCATTGTTEVARPDWNTGRQILTSSSNGVAKGVPFRWASLSAAQQALLNTNPQTNASDGLGSDRLNFIRGARTKEKANGGTFRNRNFLMGAIVDSSAEFVGAPRETYELSTVLPEAASYKTYKQNYASRPGVVYVGANDGMLHALNSNTGVELFAYVPAAVYARLGQLTNPLFSFENYVDNTPAIRDVYINGSWKSVLIGTLRRGGQGVFALDVTNTPTEGSAGTSVLWDLTDVDDTDLGYTYGKPFIARLASGNWAALVPAGYNSQEADARTGSGASVLFVIDIATGSVLRKFNVTTEGGDAASTGLAAPVLTDLDADSVAEFAYAGDLNGNIWRFDLTNASPGSWTVSRLYKPTTAFDRPITAQPRVLRHPTLGIPIVLVGTGKFIEVNDRSPAIPTQAFYGIRDTGTLVNQTDLSTASVIASTSIRKVSSFTAPASGSKGWQILFTDTTNAAGERVISPAGIRQDTNIVFFSTLIPGGTDPCIPGGSSFVMFANALTGGPSTTGVPFFDTNGDGNINSSDDATAQGKYVASLVPGVASVIQQGGGVGAILFPPPPPGTGGAGAGTLKMPVPEWRRHGWREKFIHQ